MKEQNKLKTLLKIISSSLSSSPSITLTICVCVLAIAIAVAFAVTSDNTPDDRDTEDISRTYTSDSRDSSESQYPPDSSYITNDSANDTSDDGGSTDGITDTEGDTTTEAVTEPPYVFELSSLTVKGDYTPSNAGLDELYEALTAFGRRVGFIAVDINSGMTLSYDADEKFKPASIIKAAYVYYVCTEIDRGIASLDDTIIYTESDLVYGNGKIGKSGFGTEYTIRDVIYHTVTTSDNEGYYMLIRHFGRSGYDKFIRSLGCKTGFISPTRWPQVTARDFAVIWQAIYDYRNETATGQWLYKLFLDVDYMRFFKNALGVDVANKAGWNADSYNDSGIIYGDRTYILVVLSEGSYYTASKSQYNTIVSAIDSLMSEYADTADPMPDTDRFEEIETTAPVTESDPPATEPDPPVTEPDPPVTEPDPPATEPDPPATEPDPPVTEPDPPVTEPDPPVTEPDPPVTEPDPPATETDSPATDTETALSPASAAKDNVSILPAPMSAAEYTNLIAEAEKYLGYSYTWGGSSPKTGFDCSGYVSYVINNCGNGWYIGRLSSKMLYSACTKIKVSEAEPGDLIFFKGTYNTSGVSHVGIYVGGGKMIHCGDPISYVSVSSGYWRDHFYCYGRLNNT